LFFAHLCPPSFPTRRSSDLVQAIAERIYGSARIGLIAGLLCAVHPSLLRYVPDLHLETMLTFTVTLGVWLSCRLEERPNLPRAIDRKSTRLNSSHQIISYAV